jgi:hypothetical protein
LIWTLSAKWLLVIGGFAGGLAIPPCHNGKAVAGTIEIANVTSDTNIDVLSWFSLKWNGRLAG